MNTITLIIILATSGVSILCFYGILNINPWIFNAYQVWHGKQWHLYLLYCWYMAKRNLDNIGHTAHFWGAVYGLLFPLLCKPIIFNYFLTRLGL